MLGTIEKAETAHAAAMLADVAIKANGKAKQASVPSTCALPSMCPMSTCASSGLPTFDTIKGCQFPIAGANTAKEELHTEVASQADHQPRLFPAIARRHGDEPRELDTLTTLLKKVIKENKDKKANLYTALHVKEPYDKASTTRAPIPTSSVQSGWPKAEWFHIAFSNKGCGRARDLLIAIKEPCGKVSDPDSDTRKVSMHVGSTTPRSCPRPRTRGEATRLGPRAGARSPGQW